MKILVPILIIFLGGCHAPRPTPVVESLPIAAPANRTELRLPASVVEYTLGAYVDPKNPLIRHEAHRIHRLEKEARWDLRPTAVVELPLLTSTDSRTDESESATTPQSVEPILADPPVEPTSLTLEVASAETGPETPELSSPTPPIAKELVPAILPNASGIIDLIAISAAEDSDVNPFKVRQLPDAQIHKIELKLGGIIQGQKSCILLNGRTVKVGEQFESLTLVAIESDAALFRHRQHLMRIPVSTAVTQIRLAL